MIIETVDYRRGSIRILDQSALPAEERYLVITEPAELAEAISSLKIRGAPAIGVAAAYGVLLALERALASSVPDPPGYLFDRGGASATEGLAGADPALAAREASAAAEMLAATRPTAMNLFWALERMRAAVERGAAGDAAALCAEAAREAFAIHEEELEIERRIGEHGAALFPQGGAILTHCNAGGLATAGFGTALGIVYVLQALGRRVAVFADETRPLLQGARLTAWELYRAGVEVTLLCDGAAASLIASGRVDAVVVGADRIAANGDTANKIGTLTLAVLCARYGRPFYVVAPWSSFDLGAPSGSDIPIEERDPEEVLTLQGVAIAPAGVGAYNPAFDVTPAELVTAIVTETGIIEHPCAERIERAARASRRSD